MIDVLDVGDVASVVEASRVGSVVGASEGRASVLASDVGEGEAVAAGVGVASNAEDSPHMSNVMHDPSKEGIPGTHSPPELGF